MGLIAASDRDGLVSRADADAVFTASPTERLRRLEDDSDNEVSDLAGVILDAYDEYLTLMRVADDELHRLVANDDSWRDIKDRAYEFHTKFVALYKALGTDRLLYEYTLV